MSERNQFTRRGFLKLAGASSAALYLAACAPGEAPAPEAPAAAAPSGPVVNSVGVELPADAAPIADQVMRIQGYNNIATSGDWFKVNYRQLPGTPIGGEPLVFLDKSYNILPAGAESWEVSEDKLSWQFKLRPGQEWSDGKPFTAQDWVDSFRYGANPETGFDFAWYFFFMKNWTAVNNGELPVEELGCRALDDLTLEVTTEYPAPYVPGWLSIAVPHCQHAYEEHGEMWSLQPETYVSSGAFTLTAVNPDGNTEWSVNPNYKGVMSPRVEKLVYVPGTQPLGASADQPQVTLAAYLADEYYHTGPWSIPNISDLRRAQQDIPDQLHSYPHFQTYYVGMNTYKPPFDDLKVRQAFSHAIDREVLTSTVLKDLGQPAYTMLMKGFPNEHVDDLKGIQAYDPELAKELLAEAGYPNGEGFPSQELWIRGPDRPEAAEAVATMLAQNLNINVSMVQAEVKTFMEELNAKELLLYWVPYQFDFVDASNFLSIWRSDGRHAWKNEEYEALLAEADSEFDDPEKRDDLFLQAERILVEDCPAAFVFHPTFWQLWKPWVSGDQLEPNDSGFQSWGYLNFIIFRDWYINNQFGA